MYRLHILAAACLLNCSRGLMFSAASTRAIYVSQIVTNSEGASLWCAPVRAAWKLSLILPNIASVAVCCPTQRGGKPHSNGSSVQLHPACQLYCQTGRRAWTSVHPRHSRGCLRPHSLQPQFDVTSLHQNL